MPSYDRFERYPTVIDLSCCGRQSCHLLPAVVTKANARLLAHLKCSRFPLTRPGLAQFGPRGPNMVRKRHASDEISAKLAHANELAAKGKTQREISKALGVSIMTYHRWKKMLKSSAPAVDRGRPI